MWKQAQILLHSTRQPQPSRLFTPLACPKMLSKSQIIFLVIVSSILLLIYMDLPDSGSILVGPLDLDGTQQ